MFTQIREQFQKVWEHQSKTQRLVLVALGVGVVALLGFFFNWANTPTYSVAFSGLAEADAGLIVEKLDEEGISYQLRGGGTILVPSNQVYDVRLRMARENLPAGGNVGYELFSGSTLGQTDFSQRVNYQRALEGELERTIASLSSVGAVRVHIVSPEKTLLSKDQQAATASITIQERSSSRLDAAQVRAITHLVASSVEGLKPENVVVVDINGNLLAMGSTGTEAASAALTDNHRAAEMAYAADVQNKVQDVLDSALGPNRSVVQANVLMDWTERETTQQSYDPASAVVRSSSVISETYLANGAAVGGIPGSATNLPDIATQATDSEEQGSQYLRSEETTNYEVTQTETREIQAPGTIDRISLSVLVDGVSDANQLQTLNTVIAAAAGIDEARGDTLAVQTLEFDRSFYEEEASQIEVEKKTDLYWRIGEIAGAVVLLAALLWYVQRLMANLRLASSKAWTPVLRPVAEMALPSPSGAASIEASPTLGLPIQQAVARSKIELPVLSAEDENLQRLVIRMAEENPAAVAETIQLWLNEDD